MLLVPSNNSFKLYMPQAAYGCSGMRTDNELFREAGVMLLNVGKITTQWPSEPGIEINAMGVCVR